MRRAGVSVAALGGAAVAVMVGGATALLAHSPAVGFAAALAAVALVGGAVAFAAMRRGHRQLQAQIEALSGIAVELARRLTLLEKRPAEGGRGSDAPRETGAIDRELGELGALLRALAEQVEEHNLLIGGGDALTVPPRAAVAQPAASREPAAPPRAPTPPEPARRSIVPPSAANAAAAQPPAEIAARLREAVGQGAVDLQLRPVMALPQRRAVHYEVVAVFRDRDGQVVGDAAAARAVPRLAGAVDALVLDRTLRIARRLKERGREVGVFVETAPELWDLDAAAAEIVGRLKAATDLAPHLVLQIAHASLRRFGAIERDLLTALQEAGFSAAVTGVDSLALDPRALHAQGVRFIKVAPRLLLAKAAAPGAEIHPDDLAGYLRRHGVTLIADPVDGEAVVAELIDMQVALAQGPLFGLPRPVRAEVFAEPAPPPPKPEPRVGDGVGSRFARRA